VLDSRGGGRIAIGDDSLVHRGALLLCYGGDIELGLNCTVNPYCILYGHGGLKLGDYVHIAAHVVLIPANHRFDSRTVPIASQGLEAEGIVIEDDVWIGTGARILDGCHIGRGAVVGAGAVVTRDVAPYSIIAGVPARQIGVRGA
jgi:acetyltransferase-like isoleucine patch superfamily enzyme